MVESALLAGAQLGVAARAALEVDAEGNVAAYARSTLKGSLFHIKQHLVSHLGLGYDVTKLAHVSHAHASLKRQLAMDGARRCVSLHDELMSEGWLAFNPAYAVDSFFMGLTGFGELMGPRCSDIFVARRTHFTPRSGCRPGWNWKRFSGKNNGTGSRRERTMLHAKHCQRCEDPSCSPEACFAQVDPELGLLPETRCGCCASPSCSGC